jgi:hypothetical protein
LHWPQLLTLCQDYYNSVKPQGLTATQRLFANKLPPRKTSIGESFSPFLPLQSFSSIPSSDTETLRNLLEVPSTPSSTSSSDSLFIPIVRSVDKLSSSLPSTISMNEDFIRASVGFRSIDTMKKQFANLYQDTVKLDIMPADAILDQRCHATMQKEARNIVPVSRPLIFGDIIHMDIVFGP